MKKEENIEKMKGILKGNLVSLVEYNNGDEVKYLAVYNRLSLDALKEIKELEEKPILFTKEEITNAGDVFPVEFLNIKRHYRLLCGEDMFKDIEISNQYLRHQLEFEFRSKLIHLRQAYLSASERKINSIILDAVPTLAPIVGALMYIKGENKFGVEKFVELYGINTKVLKEIHDVRKGRTMLNKDKDYYIDSLIQVLTEIGEKIDQMDVV